MALSDTEIKTPGANGSVLCFVLLIAFLAFGAMACGKKAPPQPLDSMLNIDTAISQQG